MVLRLTWAVEQTEEIFASIDFWEKAHGQQPGIGVFDSKLTTYTNFGRPLSRSRRGRTAAALGLRGLEATPKRWSSRSKRGSEVSTAHACRIFASRLEKLRCLLFLCKCGRIGLFGTSGYMRAMEKARIRDGKGSGWSKIAPFAILSLVSFLLGACLLCLMLWNVERLVTLGLVGKVYYVVLLPLGLAVAAFLFGVFRSYAIYTGKHVGGSLELGGPIVGFVLVVILGFSLTKPPPEGFSVTVLVHGDAGPHDLLLRNSGDVWITLGADLRQEKIGDKGQADFKNIPAGFRGQPVPISVEADGFEMSSPQKKYPLDGDSIELMIRRKVIHLSGSILDTEGRPVTNATIRAGETQVSVDNIGRFTLTLKQTGGSTEIKGEVVAPGFEIWRGRFVPSAGDATVQLHRTP